MGIGSGFGFGAGAYIAVRVLDCLFGPPNVRCEIRWETVASSTSTAPTTTTKSIEVADACVSQTKAFQDCLNRSGISDMSKCFSYMDMLSECRRTSNASDTSSRA